MTLRVWTRRVLYGEIHVVLDLFAGKTQRAIVDLEGLLACVLMA
jgi:hypothetical protein